eukprot:6203539-Pleurochrysis_carterae.AAC.6
MFNTCDSRMNSRTACVVVRGQVRASPCSFGHQTLKRTIVTGRMMKQVRGDACELGDRRVAVERTQKGAEKARSSAQIALKSLVPFADLRRAYQRVRAPPCARFCALVARARARARA